LSEALSDKYWQVCEIRDAQLLARCDELIVSIAYNLSRFMCMNK